MVSQQRRGRHTTLLVFCGISHPFFDRWWVSVRVIAILVPEIRILAASPLETLSSSWEVRALIVSLQLLHSSQKSCRSRSAIPLRGAV